MHLGHGSFGSTEAELAGRGRIVYEDYRLYHRASRVGTTGFADRDDGFLRQMEGVADPLLDLALNGQSILRRFELDQVGVHGNKVKFQTSKVKG